MENNENVKEIISENLVKLRKEHKLTQLELAEELNYSDKAISRWENGEVTPDIETLLNICSLYNITLDDLVRRHEGSKPLTKKYKSQLKNKLIITLLSVSLVWFIATIMFVYSKLIFNNLAWTVFIWAVPITCIICIIFNAIWGKRKLMFPIISVLIWSLIASIYIQLLPIYNLYLIFFIGIPLQIATILWSFLEPRRSKK